MARAFHAHLTGRAVVRIHARGSDTLAVLAALESTGRARAIIIVDAGTAGGDGFFCSIRYGTGTHNRFRRIITLEVFSCLACEIGIAAEDRTEQITEEVERTSVGVSRNNWDKEEKRENQDDRNALALHASTPPLGGVVDARTQRPCSHNGTSHGAVMHANAGHSSTVVQDFPPRSVR